ncbi:hypothetical protein KFL_002770040 [Klebsormidium nitens]|uniref:Uncharacterized protein n=1 Tax=Klebsormidium nitens TaxID=105231 RepID=A0A1Y1IBX1_KLENI|nr:hypothetical protein KFL_002770040 [Klebsormidium nitens]|eukprot:GAQ86227.1 hypothetical protein KFL_002770040 [Klebsormidium nitens]
MARGVCRSLTSGKSLASTLVLLVLVGTLATGTLAQGPILFGRPQVRVILQNVCPTDVQVYLGGENLWEQYNIRRIVNVFDPALETLLTVEEPLPSNPFILPAGETIPRLILTDNNTNQVGPFQYEGTIYVAPTGAPFPTFAEDNLSLLGSYVLPPDTTYRASGGGRFFIQSIVNTWDPTSIAAPAELIIRISCTPPPPPGPPPVPPPQTARVNITNMCSTPVRIVLSSNQANNDLWQVLNTTTNTTTSAPSTFDIPVGGSRENLLLVNINPALALPVRSGFIGATAAVGPVALVSPTGLDNIVIRSVRNSFTTPNISVFSGGPGSFILNPVATSSPEFTVAPVEVAVAVYCVAQPTLLPVGTLPAVTAAPVPPPSPPPGNLTACNNIGLGRSVECAANCACGAYIGGNITITTPTVCQANVQCAACNRGCNRDADCPPGYNCAGGCGAAAPPVTITVQIFTGQCLPNCGTMPSSTGC